MSPQSSRHPKYSEKREEILSRTSESVRRSKRKWRKVTVGGCVGGVVLIKAIEVLMPAATNIYPHVTVLGSSLYWKSLGSSLFSFSETLEVTSVSFLSLSVLRNVPSSSSSSILFPLRISLLILLSARTPSAIRQSISLFLFSFFSFFLLFSLLSLL